MHEGVVFLSAKNNANRWIIALRHFIFTKIIEIQIHLPCVAVVKIANFKVNKDMTFQNSVIKNKVYPIMFIAKSDAFLTVFKTKPTPQFHKKFLQMIDYRLF